MWICSHKTTPIKPGTGERERERERERECVGIAIIKDTNNILDETSAATVKRRRKWEGEHSGLTN